MTFGLTRGEIILIVFIFALVYSAGLLPKLAARVSKMGRPEGKSDKGGAAQREE